MDNEENSVLAGSSPAKRTNFPQAIEGAVFAIFSYFVSFVFFVVTTAVSRVIKQSGFFAK